MAHKAPWGIAVCEIEHWQPATRWMNVLLAQGIDVYEALEPLSSDSGATVPAGAFIAANCAATLEQIQQAAAHYGLQPTVLFEPPGGKVMQLFPIRIALYGGGGAPCHHMAIFNRLGFHTEFISDQHIRDGFLGKFDVLLMPGGGWRAMNGQLDPLGEQGAEQIVRFVREGGMYLSSCAGSYDAAIAPEAFLQTCPAKRCMNLVHAKVWNDQGKEWVGLDSPGVGVWTLKNADPQHPVMFGMPETFDIVHYNGPIFEAVGPQFEGVSASFELATLHALSEGFTPSERFLQPGADETPMCDTLAHRGAQQRKGVIVGGYLGFGRVLLFGSHPEFGFDAATLSDWRAPVRMLANALAWQAGSSRRRSQATFDWPLLGEAITTFSLEKDLDQLQSTADEIIDRLEVLDGRQKQIEQEPWWLDGRYSISTFGLSPQNIWEQSFAALPQMREEINCAVEAILSLKQAALETSCSAKIDKILSSLAQTIHYERPAVWQQDAGFQGMRALLAQACSLTQAAATHFEGEAPELPVLPYQHFERNPYYLTAGVYLSAISVLLGVQLLLQSYAARLQHRLDGERLFPTGRSPV